MHNPEVALAQGTIPNPPGTRPGGRSGVPPTLECWLEKLEFLRNWDGQSSGMGWSAVAGAPQEGAGKSLGLLQFLGGPEPLGPVLWGEEWTDQPW